MPLDPSLAAFLSGGANPFGAAAPQQPVQGGYAPAPQAMGSAAPSAQGAVNPGTAMGGDPAISQFNADQALIGAKRSDIALQRQYADANKPFVAAQGKVLDAQQAQLPAQKAFLDEQSRNNAARMAENQAIQAAKGNAGDILAVSQAQRERDSSAYRYQIAGLPAPVEVTLPPGYTGPMPAGVVGRLQTLADVLSSKAKDAEAMRSFNEEAARLHAAYTGMDVTAAEIASGRVKLSLEEVEQALKLSGLNVQEATLNSQAAGQPPAPGLVWDEYSQQWTTKLQAQDDAYNYNADRADARAEAKRVADQGKYGDFGSLPMSTLTSMLTESYQQENMRNANPGYPNMPPAITEEQYRATLSKAPFNLLPGTIDAMVRQARQQAVVTPGKVNPQDAIIEGLLKERAARNSGGGSTTTETFPSYNGPQLNNLPF